MTTPIKHLLISLFIILCHQVNAQTDLLKRTCSLHAEQMTIKELLDTLQQQCDVHFSYRSNIISCDSTITVHLNHTTLEHTLKNILGTPYEFKVTGHHIIILYNAGRKKNNQPLIINGNITNCFNGHGVQHVSVYIPEAHVSTLTSNDGQFHLELPNMRHPVWLNICRRGYDDTLLLINDTKQPIAIALCNSSEHLTIPTAHHLQRINPLREDPTLVKLLVPRQSVINANNLDKVYERRPAQISFLPGVGSNYVSGGVIHNSFSINILSGYSGGVDGVELGGLLNVVRNDVHGLQVGGLGNNTGGTLHGVQLAGIFNRTNEKAIGLQTAGIYNFTYHQFTGIQLGGLMNRNEKNFTGGQFAGFINHTTDTLRGIQLAGLFNHTPGSITGLQIAGTGNIAGNKVQGIQLSGIFNSCDTLHGSQMSGIMNRCTGTLQGFQFTGIINYAQNLKGVQLGLVNISERSSGIALGLFNYVKYGYRAVEVVTDELFFHGIEYKSGARHFYTLYKLTIKPGSDTWLAPGIGWGTHFNLGGHWMMSADITVSSLNKGSLASNKLSLWQRSSITLEYALSPALTLMAGPTFNQHTSENSFPISETRPKLPWKSVTRQDENKMRTTTWPGAIFAVRYNLTR